jgi:hypothetical protein
MDLDAIVPPHSCQKSAEFHCRRDSDAKIARRDDIPQALTHLREDPALHVSPSSDVLRLLFDLQSILLGFPLLAAIGAAHAVSCSPK